MTVTLIYENGSKISYGAFSSCTERYSFDEKSQKHSTDIDLVISALITNMSGDANDIYEWLIPYMKCNDIVEIQLKYLKDLKVKHHSFTTSNLSSLADMNIPVFYYNPNCIEDAQGLPVNAYGSQTDSEIVIVHCDDSIEYAVKQILKNKYKNVSHVSFIFNPEKSAAALAAKTTSYFN